MPYPRTLKIVKRLPPILNTEIILTNSAKAKAWFSFRLREATKQPLKHKNIRTAGDVGAPRGPEKCGKGFN